MAIGSGGRPSAPTVGDLPPSSISRFGASDPSDVKLWDLAAGKELLTFSTKAIEPPSLRKAMYSPTRSLSFSPDGNRLFYVAGSYGREATVQVWDATPLPDEEAEASRRRH